MRKSVPGEVDQVRGEFISFGPADIDPPHTGVGDHADEHLGVHVRLLLVEATAVELVGQETGHPRGVDLAELGREIVGVDDREATSRSNEANDPSAIPGGESRTSTLNPSVSVAM